MLSKNSNIVKYYFKKFFFVYIYIYILKLHLFLWWQRMDEFSAAITLFWCSRNIFLFIFVINVENSCTLQYYLYYIILYIILITYILTLHYIYYIIITLYYIILYYYITLYIYIILYYIILYYIILFSGFFVE